MSDDYRLNLIDKAKNVFTLKRFSKEEVHALAEKGDIKTLIGVIKDIKQTGSVKAEAIKALDNLNDPQAVSALVNNFPKDILLEDYASDVIGRCDSSKFIEPLTAALDSDNQDIQKAAVMGLWNIGDRSAVPALVAAYEKSGVTVKLRIIDVLRDLCTAEDLPVLLELDSSSMYSVIENMEDENKISALTRLIDQETEAGKRSLALRVLADLEEGPELNYFLHYLTDRQEEVRTNAIYLSRFLGGEKALEAISDLLSDPAMRVRTHAVNVLVKQGGKKFLSEVVETLSRETQQDRLEMVKKACKNGDLEALPSLSEVLKEKGLKRSANYVNEFLLGKFTEEEVKAFEEKGDIESLTAVINDYNQVYRVGKAAVRALENLDDPRAISALVNKFPIDAPWEYTALGVLKRCDSSEFVEPLTAALDSGNPDIQEAAVEGLGNIGDRSAVPALVAAHDKSQTLVKLRIGEVLNDLCTAEDLPVLLDGDRRLLKQIMSKLEDDQQIDVLSQLLEEEPEKRDQIRKLLADLEDAS